MTEIKIEVSGPPGVGKTAVVSLLREYMREAGFKVMLSAPRTADDFRECSIHAIDSILDSPPDIRIEERST